ncbi:MAG: substrate-binding domain-containing protein [Kiritimatiellae bacterium]|nr:substrate-binding domain-containing protein [Kiritimatiellia bacterium]
MKVVLYFQSSAKTNSAAEKLIGVREIAAKTDWHLQVIDVFTLPEKVRQLVSFWKPSGMIVECGERADDLSVFAGFANIPVVFIDKDPDSHPKCGFCVRHDSLAAGLEAAKDLMMKGFDNFAFVPFPGSWRWNEERRVGYLEALELNNHSCAVFESKSLDINSPAYVRDLRMFINRLQKPCAIFVANDHPAEKVIAEARLLNFQIPNQIAVLGVDNYEPICEHTQPRLSSMMPDFRRGGNLAALMLIAILRDGKNFRGARVRKYGTLQIICRESTRVLRKPVDSEVDAALRLIRNEACNGLKAETVMKSFSCSRTLAATKFRRATGHSILEEIHATQLERVKEMLSYPSQQLKSLSDFCGFKSPNTLRKFFLRETGMTMSDWRKAMHDHIDPKHESPSGSPNLTAKRVTPDCHGKMTQ